MDDEWTDAERRMGGERRGHVMAGGGEGNRTADDMKCNWNDRLLNGRRRHQKLPD